MGKSLILSALCASFSFGFVFTAWADQADHAHEKGPHGGLVKTLGNLHMEAVHQKDILNFYLLDAKGKSPAKRELNEGNITIIIPGKPLSKIDIPASSGFSEISVPLLSTEKKFTALVKLKINNENLNAKFNFKD